ncbi:hypothetical protein CDAR_256521 [Caerostris darwini]|uniref:Uncharacterized protein n=1 Tax=Caerostris darwini TaxID=1538125 RepID=A0AAV4PDV1_9ARAC|nr:hypothetical protein CDAR_256521 [Caerostris darwini]
MNLLSIRSIIWAQKIPLKRLMLLPRLELVISHWDRKEGSSYLKELGKIENLCSAFSYKNQSLIFNFILKLCKPAKHLSTAKETACARKIVGDFVQRRTPIDQAETILESI